MPEQERDEELEQLLDVSAFNSGVDMAIDTLLAIIGPGGMVNRLDIENARGHAKRVGPTEQEPSEAECIVWAMRNGLLDKPLLAWRYNNKHYPNGAGAPELDAEILADIRRRMKGAANG